jgi:hypothetical protein
MAGVIARMGSSRDRSRLPSFGANRGNGAGNGTRGTRRRVVADLRNETAARPPAADGPFNRQGLHRKLHSTATGSAPGNRTRPARRNAAGRRSACRARRLQPRGRFRARRCVIAARPHPHDFRAFEPGAPRSARHRLPTSAAHRGVWCGNGGCERGARRTARNPRRRRSSGVPGPTLVRSLTYISRCLRARLKRRQPWRRDENVDGCDTAANVAYEARSSEQLPRLAARPTRAAIAQRYRRLPPARRFTKHPAIWRRPLDHIRRSRTLAATARSARRRSHGNGGASEGWSRCEARRS